MTTTLTNRPDFRAGIWVLDAAHSELSFSVRHLAISKVRGVFKTFDVTVVVPEDADGISVTATVEVSSVDTGQDARDNHLRTSDFFLVEEHPQMTFTSTSITVDGDDFTLTGDLTLRGVTQPVTLKGEFNGITADAYGNIKAGASATTKINRTDFGVNYNTALEAGGFTLGDDVSITIELQLIEAPSS